jgi:DNA-3-methyladenine glycosylase II
VVRAADPAALRTSVGLSHAKVRYLRSLAEHVLDGSLELGKLGRLSDEEVIARLTAISGIGRWSADIFLMFHLQRPDVLPVGDLGIRKAFQAVYGLPALPEAAEMERIAEPWRPYRSLASLFLWRASSTVPV